MDWAALEAAGLWDPGAPNAAERRALLEWYAAEGLTAEAVIAAVRAGTPLVAVAGERRLGGGSLSVEEAATVLGMTPERVQALRLALALPPAAPGAQTIDEGDLASFRAFTLAAGLFGEAATQQFTRVVGSSMARVAHAAIALFLSAVEKPLVTGGGDERALAQANLAAFELLDVVVPVMRGALRAHTREAMRRERSARSGARAFETMRLAVGFVDLVGFTALSRTLSTDALVALIDAFEGFAQDVTTARGGRVVKFVGDAVMFVCLEAAAACDVALALLERCAGEPGITPRGGLAAGEVIARGGDYYGEFVNLAARLAELAVPGEVLVTMPVAEAAGGGALRFAAAGKRLPKGFDQPIALCTVERA